MDKGLFIAGKRREFEENARAKKIKFEVWLCAEANRLFPEIRYSHALSVKDVFLTILSFLKPVDVYNLRIALNHDWALRRHYKKELAWPKCYLENTPHHTCKYVKDCVNCRGDIFILSGCAFTAHNDVCSFCGNVCCKSAGKWIVLKFNECKGREYYACHECYASKIWIPMHHDYSRLLDSHTMAFGKDMLRYTLYHNDINVDAVAIYDHAAKRRRN